MPLSFVLKKDQKKDDKKEEISLEDLIEKERANLGPNQVKFSIENKECFLKESNEIFRIIENLRSLRYKHFSIKEESHCF